MNSNEQNGLIGPVRTIHEQTIRLPKKEDTHAGTVPVRAKTVTYNEEGNKTEEVYFRADGSLLRKVVFVHDASGRLVEETSFNAIGSLVQKHAFSYNSVGKLIEESLYNADGIIIGRCVYKHDTSNGESERLCSGALAVRTSVSLRLGSIGEFHLGTYLNEAACLMKTVYDARGNSTEVTFYGDNEVLLSKVTFEYGSADELIKQTNYIGNVFLDATEAANSNHNLVLWSKSTYTYDFNKNTVEMSEYRTDGSLIIKTVYVHDREGRITEKTEYDSRGSLRSSESYIREFDRQGNWITETVQQQSSLTGNPEPNTTVIVTNRTIAYHQNIKSTDL